MSVAVAQWGSALSLESALRLLQLRNLAQRFAPAGATPLPRTQSTNSVSAAFHPAASFGPVLCLPADPSAFASVYILVNLSKQPQTISLPGPMNDVLESGSRSSVELPIYGVAVLAPPQ
jgi:hypothetical protein